MTKTFASHLSRISAGFVAVLVGYGSSAAIIFQAAHAVGASPEIQASWFWALGLGMGVTCIGLSLATKSPVLTAWSTPGAALLGTSLAGVPLSDAVGAFLCASLLMLMVGFSGKIDRVLAHIPKSLASAMLAGVLFRFGANAFAAAATDTALVGIIMLAFFLARRWIARYAVPMALAAGLVSVFVLGKVHPGALQWSLAKPVFTAPTFSLPVMLGTGIPLFLVTLVSQNVPGLAVLRANGYQTGAAPLIGWTGFTGVILAPFGGFAFNLAAITAAICMSEGADPDPRKRYLAAIWAGGFYLMTGLFGGMVAAVLAAVPPALIAAVAGLALLATIGSSLHAALADETQREPALVTFLATASGLTLFGIGSAAWGLVFGVVVAWLLKKRCGTSAQSVK